MPGGSDFLLFIYFILFLTLASRKNVCHEKADGYLCVVISCITCVAVALLLTFCIGCWYCWGVVCTVYTYIIFLLPPLIVTSSSTGKFRKAVSQVSFSTCGSKKCCIFLVLYIHLPFVLFFFQDSEVKLFWKGERERKNALKLLSCPIVNSHVYTCLFLKRMFLKI